MPSPARACGLLTATALLLGFTPPGRTADRDPAERGMDLFIHAPGAGVSGGRLVIQLRVFGFPTVSTLTPLAGARVEAVWDATSLGKSTPAPAPPGAGTSDDAGRAHLEVEIPRGTRKTLKLLLSARWHDHQRTREIEVQRLPAQEIDLRVSDTAVIPGGALAGWVFVRDVVSGRPVPNAAVDLELKEGTVTRFARRLSTDRSGVAAAQIPVPFTDDPDWHWTLTARTAFSGGDNADATLTLKVREELPAQPALTVRWAEPAVRPGVRTSFQIRALDGAGLALARLPVRYWTGSRGTEAPTDDDEWQHVSTAAATDREGGVAVPIDTPATISPRGAGLTVVVRTIVEGRTLSATATLDLAVPRPTLKIIPEFGVLLPGQTQRLFVHISVGETPIATRLALDGHGLSARIGTDARGWGEFHWTVPPDVGATVPEGVTSDCAGNVAATVRVRLLEPIPALGSAARAAATSDPIEHCVRVDRDAIGAVRPLRPLVRAGDTLALDVVGGVASRTRGTTPTPTRPSVILHTPTQSASAGAWLAGAGDSTAGNGSLRLPESARGVWTITAAGLRTEWRDRTSKRSDVRKESEDNNEINDTDGIDDSGEDGETHRTSEGVLPGSVLVLPRVLPKLTARRIDGDRRAPDGTIELEAELSDGHGQPLTGTVGAVVVDKHGGARPESLLALDTRRALAAEFDVREADIDDFLEGDARFDVMRWGALAQSEPRAQPRIVDPTATVDDDIQHAFRKIVRSLEGGLFESSGDPERIRDVRIRVGAGFGLNPEMLTLTTEAMNDPPTTPGGEPWRLADLMAVDPQVRYDVVARRVARLKLFRVLSAIRKHLYDSHLDFDEPALRDPNALLRRMVRAGAIKAADLLDPWGHGLTFVRAPGPRIPFLSQVPGYRLQAAGPDGRFGTGDDIRDPFQRVLRSNTPYARAVEEDRLVDARWDMRVGDDTIEAWQETLDRSTGSSLGDSADGIGGLGLAGGGSGGYGRGAGALGGRSTGGVDLGPSVWLPPRRTDERGHIRLKVPLGTADTTWQIILVGVPDAASPAVASIEVPMSAPLSLAVNTGASWIQGDQVGVAIAVRNRTDNRLNATLKVSAAGAAALADPNVTSRIIDLLPRSTTPAVIFVRAPRVGTGIFDASVTAPGVVPDAVRHQWEIKAPAEARVITQASWIDGEATLALAAGAQGTSSAGMTPAGPARLVLERGVAPALAAALESLRPERLTGLRAIADALEVFARVRAWALGLGGDTDKLAVRAKELAGLAIGRRDAHTRSDSKHPSHGNRTGAEDEALLLRIRLWEQAAGASSGKPASGEASRRSDADCPPKKFDASPERLDWLEARSPGRPGTDRACWVAFEASALQELAGSGDPLLLARTLLATLDRSSSALVTAALADRLRAAAPVRADGTLVLPAPLASDRAARSLILAAAVRARGLGHVEPAAAAGAAALQARLALERDADGGYGSVQATRAVVRALLESEGRGPAPSATIEVQWSQRLSDGRAGAGGRVSLGRSGASTIALGATVSAVTLRATAPGVLARLERPMFRWFNRPIDPGASPLSLQVEAPRAARAQATSDLNVSFRHSLGRSAPVVVRIPLPPGANLADEVSGVRQVQGALYVRTDVDSDPLPRVLAIPLRFALSGTVTLSEATARIDDDDLPVARAPARPLVIQAARP